MSTYISDQTFNKVNYTKEALPKGKYEYCTFSNCNFLNCDLSDFSFLECEFIDCDLSNVKLQGTSLQEIGFNRCKLLGLQFEDCNSFLFSANFNDCLLNHSSFYQVKLPKVKMIKCVLQEVDFTETDLSSALFEDCDLMNATFDRSILEKANFNTAINYVIDPENNRIKGASFSMPAVVGLLDKYGIKVTRA